MRQKKSMTRIAPFFIFIALSTLVPGAALACEGVSEETLEITNGEAIFEQSFKFPGAPPETLEWSIDNGDATEEVTLGTLALGGANAADYKENGGCNGAKLMPKKTNKCTDVIKFEKEPGTEASVTGSGTYTNGKKVTYKLNLKH
jgi:hypothetical protein